MVVVLCVSEVGYYFDIVLMNYKDSVFLQNKVSTGRIPSNKRLLLTYKLIFELILD